MLAGPRTCQGARGAIAGLGQKCSFAAGLALALAVSACVEPPPPADLSASEGVFDRPQALLYVGDLLVVANTGWRPGDFGAGSVVVLDAATGAVHTRIATSRPNPQRLVVHGDTLYVLNTGVIDLSDFDHPTAASAGSVDALALATLRSATAPDWSLEIPVVPGPEANAAAPVDLAFNGEAGLITLGVANATRRLDLATRSIEAPVFYTDFAQTGLGSVRAWGAGWLVADFNSDQLHVIDAAGQPWPCAVSVGEHPREVEGAGALNVRGDEAWLVLAFSAKVRRLDLSAANPRQPDCGITVSTAFGPVGEVPNDLHIRGDRAWVVDSGRNRVEAFDLATGASVQRLTLAPDSNPFHLAFRDDGRQLAVSEWVAGAVTVFDLVRGEARRFGADAAPPEAPADGPPETLDERAFADAVVSAPEADLDRPFGDPDLAVNGVRGASGGGRDVYGLSAGEALVLAWSSRALVDGPGADLAVFENAFDYPYGVFMDLTVVEVSSDGARWVAFEHAYLAADPQSYQPDPELWQGFAGRTPVILNADTHPTNPFGPGAGGDTFDLADLPAADAETAAIAQNGVRFVRLSAAGDHLDPNTGAPFPADPVSNGPDIDGVAGRYLVPAP
jgi:hypothetical protein